MIEHLWFIPAGIYGAMTVILVSNLIYLLLVERMASAVRPPVLSVLIPARNEEKNLQRLLPSLLNQEGVSFEAIVYDDGSEDGTWDVLQSVEDSRIVPVRGGSEPPPDGWLGKTHALFKAARHARGDIYVFLDADAVLTRPDSLARMVGRLLATQERSAMSMIPDWSPGGGGLIVSLAANSMLLSIPWLLVNRLGFSSMGALNGQCWMMRAADYHEVEPHEAQKGEILEDVQIGRYLLRCGFGVWLAPARKYVSVRMYDSLSDTWLGLRKNAYLLFGGTPLRFLFTSSISLSLFILAPLLNPLFLVWQMLLKLVTDRIAGFRPVLALLAPVSYLLGWLVSWDSFLHHATGRVVWKGRSVK